MNSIEQQIKHNIETIAQLKRQNRRLHRQALVGQSVRTALVSGKLKCGDIIILAGNFAKWIIAGTDTDCNLLQHDQMGPMSLETGNYMCNTGRTPDRSIKAIYDSMEDYFQARGTGGAETVSLTDDLAKFVAEANTLMIECYRYLDFISPMACKCVRPQTDADICTCCKLREDIEGMQIRAAELMICESEEPSGEAS